jgi:transcriptional regulator with XRE-family HTH domain
MLRNSGHRADPMCDYLGHSWANTVHTRYVKEPMAASMKGRSLPLSIAHPDLPPQDELQRRLRAARILRDLTVVQLSEQVHPSARLGERTLRKLESGESIFTIKELRELAIALAVPLEWFTLPDPMQRIAGESADPASLMARMTSLEQAIAGVLEATGLEGSAPSPASPPRPAPTPTPAGKPRSPRQGRSQRSQ